MGFHPMAPQRRGKIVSLTFERRWATVVAGNREAVRPRLEHGEGDPQCLLDDLIAPTGAVNLREAPWMVGLARAATPAMQWGRVVG
jgi:hypothetical protein